MGANGGRLVQSGEASDAGLGLTQMHNVMSYGVAVLRMFRLCVQNAALGAQSEHAYRVSVQDGSRLYCLRCREAEVCNPSYL